MVIMAVSLIYSLKTLMDAPSVSLIVPGVEVLGSTQTDTNKLNDGQRMTLSKRYYVTSFDSAIYSIPPLKVKVVLGRKLAELTE